MSVNQLITATEETTWDSLTRKLKDLQMNYMVQELQVVESDDLNSSGVVISEAYCGLAEVFSEIQAETLSPHCKGDHAIELLERTTLPFELMYNLSVKELKVLQKYLNTNLENRFIQPL